MGPASKGGGTKRPVGSTPKNPIRINLSDGFTADDLLKRVKSKFKSISNVHTKSHTAHIVLGKNVGRGGSAAARAKVAKVTTKLSKNVGKPPGGGD